MGRGAELSSGRGWTGDKRVIREEMLPTAGSLVYPDSGASAGGPGWGLSRAWAQAKGEQEERSTGAVPLRTDWGSSNTGIPRAACREHTLRALG